ncbi:MAG: LURP-one-related family protein [Anaerolineales bacterium]|nr:LURP-one-related family protein [Anaerolineales bacterium]
MRKPRAQQRQEKRQVFGRGGTATRYRMREKLISFGNDFWIEDEKGRRAFKIDGKMLRVRDTLFFEDVNGNELCKIQQRLVSIRDTMTIEGPKGETLATVKKALITPCVIAGLSRWGTVLICGCRAISSTTNILLAMVIVRSLRYPNAGFG